MLKIFITKFMGRDVLITNEQSRYTMIFIGFNNVRVCVDITNAVDLSLKENYAIINMRRVCEDVVHIKTDDNVGEIRITDLLKVQIGDSEVYMLDIENDRLRKLVAGRLITLFLMTIPENDIPSKVLLSMMNVDGADLGKVISLISSNYLKLICRAVYPIIKCGENHPNRLAHIYSEQLVLDYTTELVSQIYFTESGKMFATDIEDIFKLVYDHTPSERLEILKFQLKMVELAAKQRNLDGLNPNRKTKSAIEHENLITTLEATKRLLKISANVGVKSESMPTADDIAKWGEQCPQ